MCVHMALYYLISLIAAIEMPICSSLISILISCLSEENCTFFALDKQRGIMVHY